MNIAEKNMMHELSEQLRGNITILRALLDLASKYDPKLVPFIHDALVLNSKKMERADNLINK